MWDIFPDYKKPGGSPANVAYHLHCLGADSLLLSRVGDDNKGSELLRFLKNKEIDIRYIQQDRVHPTGIVTVAFAEGEPSYTIQKPSAWDYISLTDSLKMEIDSLNAICFASLSQRNNVSRNTIQKVLAAVPDTCLKVFDLNLRPPFIDKELILNLIKKSDIIKINEHEYKTLDDWYGSKKFAEEIVENNPSKTVLLTEGKNGSSMFISEGFFHEDALPVTENGDFVGVGDAFLACFTYLKLKDTPAPKILALSNQYAAFVASQKGGMPEISNSILEQIQ